MAKEKRAFEDRSQRKKMAHHLRARESLKGCCEEGIDHRQKGPCEDIQDSDNRPWPKQRVWCDRTLVRSVFEGIVVDSVDNVDQWT